MDTQNTYGNDNDKKLLELIELLYCRLVNELKWWDNELKWWDNGFAYTSICNEICIMYTCDLINKCERNNLNKAIKSFHEMAIIEFGADENINKYWWSLTLQGLESRLAFLKKIINLLKKDHESTI